MEKRFILIDELNYNKQKDIIDDYKYNYNRYINANYDKTVEMLNYIPFIDEILNNEINDDIKTKTKKWQIMRMLEMHLKSKYYI